MNKKLLEIEGMNSSIGSLQEKIQRLVHENTAMDGEVKEAQENLRISASQNAKIKQELMQYKEIIETNERENNTLKMKIQKIMSENQGLTADFNEAQESLRLSAQTQNKLKAELEQYRNQINSNNSESETYKMKIQKLLGENQSLTGEVQEAQ